MNDLRCQDVEELLAAYAADALEPGEHRDVAIHLAECRVHDGSLEALRETYGWLAAAVTPVEPPAALRSSLLEAFDHENAAAPARDAVAPATRAAPPRQRLAPAAWFGYALAAALLLVAFGLGAWALSRDGGGSSAQIILTRDANGTLELTYLPDHGLGVIDVSLSDLEGERAYQAWRLDAAGEPVSLGVLPLTSGRFALDGDLRGATGIALSVEPAGGSPLPTSEPILVTSLN